MSWKLKLFLLAIGSALVVIIFLYAKYSSIIETTMIILIGGGMVVITTFLKFIFNRLADWAGSSLSLNTTADIVAYLVSLSIAGYLLVRGLQSYYKITEIIFGGAERVLLLYPSIGVVLILILLAVVPD